MTVGDHRRTKIVCTLGPATSSADAIRRLLVAGANVCRLNFSHGNHAEHAERVRLIRAIETELGRPIAILQDLQGPKIRVARFADPAGVVLQAGQTFRLTVDDSPGDVERVGTTFPDLIRELRVGQRLLLRDGRISLKVVAAERAQLVCEVLVGGSLGNNHGINVPEADLSVPALTEKDIADLEFGAALGVDWVALSFVRRPADLEQARQQLQRVGSHARLMAKIEKPGAVRRFGGILAAADGIMIARGDLGVELPPQAVPVLQRRLVRACIAEGKPVVVATQMLESMIENPLPTRAEASDVAHAILEGADAVMLSGETAVGRYPIEAVAMMDNIAREVEFSPEYTEILEQYHTEQTPDIADAVAHSACRLAAVLPAEAICSFTWSGSTARRVASHRPGARVVALTPSQQVARQLCLSWGVLAYLSPTPTHSDRMTCDAIDQLRAVGRIGVGDEVVVTAGVPFGQDGTTNLIRVERVI